METWDQQPSAQQDAPTDLTLPTPLSTGAMPPPGAATPGDATASHDSELISTPSANSHPPRRDNAPTARARRRVGRAIDAIGMAEGGLLTDVAIILDLAAIYVPLFGAVFDPAVPAPFAILYLRRGSRVTWLAIIVATFLMTVLTGPHFGWRLGLRGVVGLFLGWAMKRRWRTTPTLTAATLITTVTAVAAAFMVIALTGLPLQDLATELRNALEAAAWFASAASKIVGLHGYWLLIRPSLVIVGNFSLRYWPFMFFVYTACVAFPSAILYYAVANAAARVLGHEVIPFPPRWVMWLFRAFYLVVIVPVGFLLRAIWFVVTLPIHGPVWLWRLIRPRRSVFAPRAPRPASSGALEPATGASATTTHVAGGAIAAGQAHGAMRADGSSAPSDTPRDLVSAATTPLTGRPEDNTPQRQAEGERR